MNRAAIAIGVRCMSTQYTAISASVRKRTCRKPCSAATSARKRTVAVGRGIERREVVAAADEVAARWATSRASGVATPTPPGSRAERERHGHPVERDGRSDGVAGDQRTHRARPESAA